MMEHLTEIHICSASYVHYTYWMEKLTASSCFPSRKSGRDLQQIFCIMKNLCPTLDPKLLLSNHLEKQIIIVFSKAPYDDNHQCTHFKCIHI